MNLNTPQEFGTPYLLEDYISVDPPILTNSHSYCAVCQYAKSLSHCAGCKSIQYCSKDCQSSDWPTHKAVCKSYARMATRPTKGIHRRALLFPADQPKPQFIWLEFPENGFPLDIVDCFEGTPPLEELNQIAFQDKRLPFWVQIRYDGNTSGNRCLVYNKCVKNLLGDQGGKSKFRGNLVVMGFDLEDGLDKPAVDVNPGLLKPLIDYFKLRNEYGGPIFVEQPQKRYKEGEWRKFMKNTK